MGVDVLRVEALLEDVEARVRVDDGDLRTERAESVGGVSSACLPEFYSFLGEYNACCRELFSLSRVPASNR